jgi:hypothetical protein
LGIENFYCSSITHYAVLITIHGICSSQPQWLQHLAFMREGWTTPSTKIDFTYYGDTVVGHTTVIIGIHNTTKSVVEKFQFKTPPSKLPLHLNSFTRHIFNKAEYGISYGCWDVNFGKELYTGITASLQIDLISASIPDGIGPLYFLHWVNSDTFILVAAMVILWDSLCPQFISASNCNIFQYHFGIEFLAKDKNMCAHSPHFSTRSANVLWIAIVTNFCTVIIGMPSTPAFRL